MLEMESLENSTDISQVSFNKDNEEMEKQRKLTTDSGFGDEEQIDYLTNECFTRDTSLDIIDEKNIATLTDSFVNIEELTNTYSNCSFVEDNISNNSEFKTQRKRRVTPIPRSSPIEYTKLSLGMLIIIIRIVTIVAVALSQSHVTTRTA